MKQLITVFFLLTVAYATAQPVPRGEYEMSFVLMEKNSDKVIDNKNKSYKVFPSYCKRDSCEISDTFKFDGRKKSFSYFFHGTPVGPAVPSQFTINVISGTDSMKIYFAHVFNQDTLRFEKGEFFATEQFVIAKKIKTFNSTKLLNGTIYDYEISKLDKLPYYTVEEKEQSEVPCLSNEYIFKLSQLPNHEIFTINFTHYRKIKGDKLPKGARFGSYDPYTNTSEYQDHGLEFSLCSNPQEVIRNYEFEKLDTLLSETTSSFSLKDTPFKDFFPKGLNWNDINSLTFAVLSGLQVIREDLWAITLNQNNEEKQIFLSEDKGINWKKAFSVKTDAPLYLKAFNRKELYAFNGSHIYHSSDYGQTWSGNILESNTMNIVDLVIVNDTAGFLLNNNDCVLVKFNPQTGKFKRLLNIDCSYYKNKLQQKNLSIFYYDNTIIAESRGAFVISKDLGSTWTIINNDCTKLLRNSNIWSWYHNTKNIEKNEVGYYPKYYKCPNNFNRGLLLQTWDNKLYARCYRINYNSNQHSIYFLGGIKFYGL